MDYRCSFLLLIRKHSFTTSWRKVEKGKWMKDIFSDMQAKIGCTYISELPEYKRAVWFELCHMELSEYPSEQLEDFARYVFGMNFSVLKEVMTLLGKENADQLCDIMA